MIRKLPNKNVWILKSSDGKKTLGRFRSRKAAERREKQIKMFKHMKKK